MEGIGSFYPSLDLYFSENCPLFWAFDPMIPILCWHWGTVFSFGQAAVDYSLKAWGSRRNLAIAYQPNYHRFEKPTFILVSMHGVRTLPVPRNLANQWWSNKGRNCSVHSAFCGHISSLMLPGLLTRRKPGVVLLGTLPPASCKPWPGKLWGGGSWLRYMPVLLSPGRVCSWPSAAIILIVEDAEFTCRGASAIQRRYMYSRAVMVASLSLPNP